MFPVSVILKVLRPFNPESEKGEPLSATSRGGPCTSDVMGKEKAADHANPFPCFQHRRQAWARALPHFFSDTKNNHAHVSPKYSIFIKQNKKKLIGVCQYCSMGQGSMVQAPDGRRILDRHAPKLLHLPLGGNKPSVFGTWDYVRTWQKTSEPE